MAKRALGRGLKALLPDAPTAQAGFSLLEIGKLEANPRQPRTRFDPADLESLAESIRRHGILQPLLVSEEGGGRYLILAGERRWRAAQIAGLDRVPAVIREKVDDQVELELALVENLQRRDLTPFEEARAYEHLRADRGLSTAEIARRVGIDRSTVSNALRLLRLPDEVQGLIEAGELSAGHGRALLAFGSDELRIEWARRAAADGVSVRDLERAAAGARETREEKARGSAKRAERDPNIKNAEKRLSLRFGVDVEIKTKKQGGRIVLTCSDDDELTRVFDLLIGEE